MSAYYPNTVVLFGTIQEPIRKLCSHLVQNQLLPNGLASAYTVSPSDAKEKAQLVNMMSAIKYALSFVDSVCQGCSGDHKVWWLAGGAAAFLKKKTNSYGDCDLYVCCDGYFKVPKDHLDYSSSADGKITVLNLYHCSHQVQIIPVHFPVTKLEGQKLSDQKYSAFQDVFGMYILSSFDLPICRVALKFNFEKTIAVAAGQNIICRALDASCFGVIKMRHEVTLGRMSKYQQRKKEFKYNVCNLKELVVFESLSALVDDAFNAAK